MPKRKESDLLHRNADHQGCDAVYRPSIWPQLVKATTPKRVSINGLFSLVQLTPAGHEKNENRHRTVRDDEDGMFIFCGQERISVF
jgi:hypothetical protein